MENNAVFGGAIQPPLVPCLMQPIYAPMTYYVPAFVNYGPNQSLCYIPTSVYPTLPFVQGQQVEGVSGQWIQHPEQQYGYFSQPEPIPIMAQEYYPEAEVNQEEASGEEEWNSQPQDEYGYYSEPLMMDYAQMPMEYPQQLQDQHGASSFVPPFAEETQGQFAATEAFPVPAAPMKPKKPKKVKSHRIPPCALCKSNREPPSYYNSHSLKDEAGNTVCPVLQKLVCEICGQSGTQGHTIRYCPLNQNGGGPYTTMKVVRNAAGSRGIIHI